MNQTLCWQTPCQFDPADRAVVVEIDELVAPLQSTRRLLGHYVGNRRDYPSEIIGTPRGTAISYQSSHRPWLRFLKVARFAAPKTLPRCTDARIPRWHGIPPHWRLLPQRAISLVGAHGKTGYRTHSPKSLVSVVPKIALNNVLRPL